MKICSIENNEVFTDTLVIAEGVGIEHRAVMQLLKTHSTTDTLSTFQMLKVTRGGRPLEYAKLTEIQATFLITLMRNSEKVIAFKEKLTTEFFRQRQIISQLVAQQKNPDWQNIRKDGKAVYHQKTNVIKQFVDYATEQGSQNAKNYYAGLAKMENSSLFFLEQKYKNVREILTIRQLMQVATADQIVEKALLDGMEQGLSYKDCYRLAKDRVTAFAEIIGKSPVQGLIEEHKKKRIEEH